jgi:hypothetical protein
MASTPGTSRDFLVNQTARNFDGLLPEHAAGGSQESEREPLSYLKDKAAIQRHLADRLASCSAPGLAQILRGRLARSTVRHAVTTLRRMGVLREAGRSPIPRHAMRYTIQHERT